MSTPDAVALAIIAVFFLAFCLGYNLGKDAGRSAEKWDEFNRPPYGKRKP